MKYKFNIPKGYKEIQIGVVQEGDLFLLGGKRNAWYIFPNGLTINDFIKYSDKDVGSLISVFSFTIRKV